MLVGRTLRNRYQIILALYPCSEAFTPQSPKGLTTIFSTRSEAFTPQSPKGLTTIFSTRSEAFTPQSPKGLT
ncbi:MAG: hypothetical protein ACRCU2_28020, partial [Planktothrix sp.]